MTVRTANPVSGIRRRAAFVIGSAIFFVLLLWMTGVPPFTSVLLVVLVLWQMLGGALIWLGVRPQNSFLETIGMGLAIGTALSAITGVISSTIGWGPWGSLIPTTLILMQVLLKRGTQTRSPFTSDSVEGTAFLATLVVGLAAVLYALRSYPLTWTGSWRGYHIDMAFFEALANSLARFGAFQSPFMSGGEVHYHWLSYAWSGQLSVLCNAAPFVGITRVLPLVALVGSAAIVVAWTRRLSSTRWAPLLAGALLTMGGFTGAVFGGVLTVDSPSQSMSVLWLLGFTLTAVHLFQNNAKPSEFLLLAVLAVAITGGKVSAAAPALVGVVLASIVLVTRQSIGLVRGVAILVVTALPIFLTFTIFLSGSSGGGGLTFASLIDKSSSQQGLNPIDGARGVFFGTTILILATLPRWAGLLQLLINQRWRWRPETWISFGMAGSSILALIVFNGFNELWFSVTVSGPLAATSAVGVALAVNSLPKGTRPPPIAILIAAIISSLVIFIFVLLAWLTGASGGNLFVGTQRWLAPVIGWLGAILVGVVIAIWVGRFPSLKAVIAGTIIILVFVAVPGRILGAGTNQIGVLNNGIRSEWFDMHRSTDPVTLDLADVDGWSDLKMAAADWIRQNTDPSDLLATNLTLGPFVPGATHLPTYVSGITYQYDYGPPSMAPGLLDREKEVWDFINSPSDATLEPLCVAGVRWLWVDKERTLQRSWMPYAISQFENDEVVIGRLVDPQCSES